MPPEEIKKFFHGDVLSDEKSISEYSRDYSIFSVKPEVVVFPKDADDVKNLVKFVKDRKGKWVGISLTGRSAGTDMTGGPLNESIIVGFTKYFNHIKKIVSPAASSEETGGYAIVEPGVYFRDFEKELKKTGSLYPPYPASKDLCALGGMISNNSGGEKTLAYGKTEDYVEELKIVLADGEEHLFGPISGGVLQAKMEEKGFEGDIYRKIYDLVQKNYDAIRAAKPDVSKNSAGYALWNVWDKKIFNLAKLVVGSQGTLGLVTEARLRLVKEKKFRRMAVIFLRDLRHLADLIVEMLKLKPEIMESYDDKTLSVALRFLPAIIKSMKGSFFKLIWQFLPEAFMILRGGLPKMVLLIEFASDNKEELDNRLELAKNIAQKFKILVRLLRDENEAQKYWTIRRQSFALLHDHSTGKDTAPFIDDIIVRPEHLPEFLPKLNQILDKYKKSLIYTIAGHPGDGNFHIIPLMNLKDPAVVALIPKISEEVYSLVLEYKGSFTAEHNDGLIRSPYLEKMYGAKMAALFGEVKNIFDPQNIFNPGKKVGGNLDYSLSHIKAHS